MRDKDPHGDVETRPETGAVNQGIPTGDKAWDPELRSWLRERLKPFSLQGAGASQGEGNHPTGESRESYASSHGRFRRLRRAWLVESLSARKGAEKGKGKKRGSFNSEARWFMKAPLAIPMKYGSGLHSAAWSDTRYIDPGHANASDLNDGTSRDAPWRSLWPLRILFGDPARWRGVRVRIKSGTVLSPDTEHQAYLDFKRQARSRIAILRALDREYNKFVTMDGNLATYHFLMLPEDNEYPIRLDTYTDVGDLGVSVAHIQGTLFYDVSQERVDGTTGLNAVSATCWTEASCAWDSVTGPYCSSASAITMVRCSNVRIEGLYISGFFKGIRAHGPCHDLQIERIVFLNIKDAGFQVNLREDRNEFILYSKASGGSIYLYYPTNAKYYPRSIIVRNCVFTHVGFDTGSAAVWLGLCVSNVFIAGCWFERVVDGIMCEGSGSDLVIVDNVFTHCLDGEDAGGDGNAIDLKDVRGRTDSSRGRRVIIAYNLMIDNYGVALIIHKCTKDVDVFGNVIIGNLQGIAIQATKQKHIFPWAYRSQVYDMASAYDRQEMVAARNLVRTFQSSEPYAFRSGKP